MIDVPAIHCPVRDKVQLRKLLDDSFCNEDEFISLDLGRMSAWKMCKGIEYIAQHSQQLERLIQ